MNRSGLKKRIIELTGQQESVVDSVLEALESIIPDLLSRGQELHWAELMTAHTIWKRPADVHGQLFYQDKPGTKIRYRYPVCSFSGRIVRSMKEKKYNLADKKIREFFEKKE